jgi:hypothetical protein
MASRRRFLQWGTGTLVLAGAGVIAWRANDNPQARRLHFATLDAALRELDRLGDARPLDPTTAFSWSQTLQHLAQSIEYAMLGFPVAKPAVFQATVGRAAFAAFATLGRMHHGLDEPIPGAPPLDAALDADHAAARLRRAIADFRAFRGPLQPHFAYGALDPGDYATAHCLHLADHLSAFDVA